MCLTGFALAPPLGCGMGRSVVGWLRRGNGGGWEFDGVQFLAHVGPNEALVHPVDFLAGVVDQLHHLGLRYALLGPVRDKRDAGGMRTGRSHR